MVETTSSETKALTPGVSLTSLQEKTSDLSQSLTTIEELLVLSGKMKGKRIRALIDSGSSGNFISTSMVEACNLQTQQHIDPLEVIVADGRSLTGVDCVTKVPFSIGKVRGLFSGEVYLLDEFDLILGIPWLTERRVLLSPHLGLLKLTDENNRMVTLKCERQYIESVNGQL